MSDYNRDEAERLARELEADADLARAGTHRSAAEQLRASVDLLAHKQRVIDQRDRDLDALVILVAQAVGTDEDRECAEMEEMDEFDPWNALRNHIANLATSHDNLIHAEARAIAAEAQLDATREALGPARIEAADGYPDAAVRALIAERDALRTMPTWADAVCLALIGAGFADKDDRFREDPAGCIAELRTDRDRLAAEVETLRKERDEAREEISKANRLAQEAHNILSAAFVMPEVHLLPRIERLGEMSAKFRAQRDSAIAERDEALEIITTWRAWSDTVAPSWFVEEGNTDDERRDIISRRMNALVRQDGDLSDRLAAVGHERDEARRECERLRSQSFDSDVRIRAVNAELRKDLDKLTASREAWLEYTRSVEADRSLLAENLAACQEDLKRQREVIAGLNREVEEMATASVRDHAEYKNRRNQQFAAYELAHRATIAFLLDRKEQYDNSSGYHAFVEELVADIAIHRHVTLAEAGEYDDLMPRVKRIIASRVAALSPKDPTHE